MSLSLLASACTNDLHVSTAKFFHQVLTWLQTYQG